MDGAILAGGESRRLGRAKAFVELGGRPLISWVLESLRPLFREIIIVANRIEPFSRFGCQVIQDIIPGHGPMGGIYTALSFIKERQVFVAACDTPFLSQEVVRYLVSQSPPLSASGGGSGGEAYEIVVAQLSDGFHPLQAVYARDCLTRMYECLISSRLSLINFLREARVRVISEQEIKSLDPRQISFFNINTQHDLEQAGALLSSQAKSTSGPLTS